MKVCVIQFIKADASVGEVGALGRAANIELHQVGLGFVPEAAKRSEGLLSRHRAAAGAGLVKAREALASGDYEMVILDEICVAVAKGLVAESDVIAAIEAAGLKTVVVLTGRGATENLIALADTVTEMRCIKHGFHKGIAAQKGVEL
jgi:cob(I)alamin adenosyltransferase